MVRLAASKLAVPYIVSDIELRSPGISYTIETIRGIRKKHKKFERFLYLIGEDNIPELMKWKSPEEIAREVEIICVRRPGSFEYDKSILRKFRIKFIDTELYDLSSTNIRKKLFRNEDVKEMLPEKVRSFIMKKKLYTG